MEELLKIEDLSKSFVMHRANRRILGCQHISLSLAPGEFVGITGRSGSGKSTILRCIYRTNLPESGAIWYDSEAFGPLDLCQATERMLHHFDIDESLWPLYPRTFSGGEKLRLNIAAAMIKQPRLLLLDEPTASLDAASKVKVRELIEQLKAQGTTMLGIFHDLEFMEGLCDHEFNMQKGEMVE